MNENALKKAGITVTRELSTLEVNKIASNISDKICSSFPEHKLDHSDLFSSLSRLTMYFAEFEDNSAAKYYYKDNSIYFREDIDFKKLETPSIHECLHFIQTLKNRNGKLLRLGLYDLTKFKPTGLSLNEASVQLMASEANGAKMDNVKYYGMDLTTISPNYYPIQCTLVRQMAYFTGTYPLYHSTIYSNDIFKNTFILKSNEKAYNKIVNNLDLIEQYEENIQKLSIHLSEIENNIKKYGSIQGTINDLKKQIQKITLETQELILVNCAYSDLELVRDYQSVNDLKNKLYKFEKYWIHTDGYDFFNQFYYKMMDELEYKNRLIRKYGILNQFKDIRESLALIETKPAPLSLFKTATQKIKELLHINKENKNTEKEL